MKSRGWYQNIVREEYLAHLAREDAKKKSATCPVCKVEDGAHRPYCPVLDREERQEDKSNKNINEDSETRGYETVLKPRLVTGNSCIYCERKAGQYHSPECSRPSDVPPESSASKAQLLKDILENLKRCNRSLEKLVEAVEEVQKSEE